MKHILVGLFALIVTMVYGQSLVIQFDEVDVEQGGQIMVGFYDSAEHWTEEVGVIRGEVISVDNTSQQVLEVSDLKVGTYAIALLHDNNYDGKMNKTLFGLPKEGYGFSNNARGRLGPPTFDDASFTLTEGETTLLVIKIKY